MSVIVPAAEPLTFTSGDFALSVVPHPTDGFRIRASDVARHLGFRDAGTMLNAVPDADKGYGLARTPGGDQRVWFLTEPGFYRVMGQRQADRIKAPEVRDVVRAFQDWVFRDVLPAVRKGPAVPTPRAELSNRQLAEMVIAESDRADAAEQQVTVLAPKAAASDAFAATPGDLKMGAAANALQVGRNTLFKWLRAERILQADGRPYQTHANWFHVATSTRTTPSGEVISYTPHITGEGLHKLHSYLVKRGYNVRKPDVQLALVSADARHAEVPQLTQ